MNTGVGITNISIDWKHLSLTAPIPTPSPTQCVYYFASYISYFATTAASVFAVPVHLEALAVDDGRARLVVLLLGDPHLLEGREGGEDGAADPDGVLALRGGDDLDLHGRRGERGDLLREAVRDAVEHGGAAREDDVGVEVLADVDVALHDGLEHGVVGARRLLSDEGRLEEHLGAAEALVADGPM